MIPGTSVKLGCSKKSVSVLVIIFCFSFGIITTIFGVDFCLDNQMVNKLMPDLLIIGLSAILLGVFCFISTCIGTCGVIRDSLIIIEIYGILLIILTILYTVFATYVLICSLTFQQNFTENMIKAFQNYQRNEISRKAVDSLQYLGSCCGLYGPKYWSNLTHIPSTCCPDEVNMYLLCGEEMSFKAGCRAKAVEHYENIFLPLYVNYYSSSILSLIFGVFMIWNSKTTRKSRSHDEPNTPKAHGDPMVRTSSVTKITPRKSLLKNGSSLPGVHKFFGFSFADLKSEPPKPETYGKKLQLQPQQQSLSRAKDKKDRAPPTMPRAKKNDTLSPAKIPPLSPRKRKKSDIPSYMQPSTSHRK